MLREEAEAQAELPADWRRNLAVEVVEGLDDLVPVPEGNLLSIRALHCAEREVLRVEGRVHAIVLLLGLRQRAAQRRRRGGGAHLCLRHLAHDGEPEPLGLCLRALSVASGSRAARALRGGGLLLRSCSGSSPCHGMVDASRAGHRRPPHLPAAVDGLRLRGCGLRFRCSRLLLCGHQHVLVTKGTFLEAALQQPLAQLLLHLRPRLHLGRDRLDEQLRVRDRPNYRRMRETRHRRPLHDCGLLLQHGLVLLDLPLLLLFLFLFLRSGLVGARANDRRWRKPVEERQRSAAVRGLVAALHAGSVGLNTSIGVAVALLCLLVLLGAIGLIAVLAVLGFVAILADILLGRLVVEKLLLIQHYGSAILLTIKLVEHLAQSLLI
mmetsp:Transcript_6616/g.16860  ORF Transcript_6616/g.16860 Transcript_6616/m.16860 type:complete len:380 (+) Transcript_6616:560-1699(+)